MLSNRSFGHLAVSVVVIFLGVFFAAAQPPPKGTDTDVAQKPKKVTVEPDGAYKRWATQDVPYILTDAERKAYEKLKTNEERENFIVMFWRNRDPDPDTEENEYRDAYYERIAYVNEHFSSGIPGWKTDRGRIYIRWGKPDSVESNPSGGSYEKRSYEGGGSAITYPFETWFYRHLDGVGDGIEIEFVDRTGSGEYRMARDLSEKYLTIGPARSDANAVYLREQDSPFRRQEISSGLEKPPPVRYSEIDRILSDSPVLDKNPLGLDMQIGFFRQSENNVIVTFTVQADNKDLKFDQNGTVQTARLNVLGRLTSVAGQRIGTFEDAIATNATNEDLIAAKDRKSVYQRAVALQPGTYRVDVAVRDVATGNKGVLSMGFSVPRYDPSKLSTSSLILASMLRATSDRDIGDRFVIGNTKLIPNLSGVYKRGQPVGVFLQIYNAGIDQTTLRPKVDVEYLISKEGRQVSRSIEDWSGLSDSTERITLARSFPTEALEPGNYSIRVITRDRVGEKPQVIENNAAFTIVK